MAMTVSITAMIKQCSGLLGTKDVTDWEDEFISSVVEKVSHSNTQVLSIKQLEIIERIYKKHFG